MKGCETQKGHFPRAQSGFYDKYMQGNGLDIGFAGYVENPEPILPNAIGIDVGYPGYDGKVLPFASESQDFVFAGHVLEHVDEWQWAIQEWFRVVKLNGFLILVLPHQWLYEKKATLPSQFCADHKRFYTPKTVLEQVEAALPYNNYRIVHFRDVDDNYNYQRDPLHTMDWWTERFEIECVLKKIQKPHWKLVGE